MDCMGILSSRSCVRYWVSILTFWGCVLVAGGQTTETALSSYVGGSFFESIRFLTIRDFQHVALRVHDQGDCVYVVYEGVSLEWAQASRVFHSAQQGTLTLIGPWECPEDFYQQQKTNAYVFEGGTTCFDPPLPMNGRWIPRYDEQSDSFSLGGLYVSRLPARVYMHTGCYDLYPCGGFAYHPLRSSLPWQDRTMIWKVSNGAHLEVLVPKNLNISLCCSYPLSVSQLQGSFEGPLSIELHGCTLNLDAIEGAGSVSIYNKSGLVTINRVRKVGAAISFFAFRGGRYNIQNLSFEALLQPDLFPCTEDLLRARPGVLVLSSVDEGFFCVDRIAAACVQLAAAGGYIAFNSGFIHRLNAYVGAHARLRVNGRVNVLGLMQEPGSPEDNCIIKRVNHRIPYQAGPKLILGYPLDSDTQP